MKWIEFKKGDPVPEGHTVVLDDKGQVFNVTDPDAEPAGHEGKAVGYVIAADIQWSHVDRWTKHQPENATMLLKFKNGTIGAADCGEEPAMYVGAVSWCYIWDNQVDPTLEKCGVCGIKTPNLHDHMTAIHVEEDTVEGVSTFEESDHITPSDMLRKSAQHIEDRASMRDCPDGERSMLKTITAFNALEGTDLTEEQGWRFMVALKYARATAGTFVIDDYEDMAAYAALAAESAAK